MAGEGRQKRLVGGGGGGGGGRGGSGWPALPARVGAGRQRSGRLERTFLPSQAAGGEARALWIGPRRSLPKLPSRRGAAASKVAKARCTISTVPTRAQNPRAPARLPSSTPQKIFNRALTRST